jgi:membrane protein insertase Oxa1/YidC/SpoIIIJ
MSYIDLMISMFIFISMFYALKKRNAFKNGTVSFTSINVAGLFLILIAILFVVEYFLVEGMYDSLKSNSFKKN